MVLVFSVVGWYDHFESVGGGRRALEDVDDLILITGRIAQRDGSLGINSNTLERAAVLPAHDYDSEHSAGGRVDRKARTNVFLWVAMVCVQSSTTQMTTTTL